MNHRAESVLATVAGALLVGVALSAPVPLFAQTPEPAAAATYPTFDPPADVNAQVPSIKFDKVTFKPCKGGLNPNTRTIGTADSWGRHCEPISAVITLGYTQHGRFHLSGLPDWADTEPYDFQAKVAPQDVDTWQNMNVPTRRIMVRNMLAEVLHLKVHAVTETHPGYALVIAPGGLNMTEYKDGDSLTTPSGQVVTAAGAGGGNASSFQVLAWPMSGLADILTVRLDRDVVDKTGVPPTKRYNFSIQVPARRRDPQDPEERAKLTAATMEDLKRFGLKLEPADIESTLIVVDHIDRPPVADQPSE